VAVPAPLFCKTRNCPGIPVVVVAPSHTRRLLYRIREAIVPELANRIQHLPPDPASDTAEEYRIPLLETVINAVVAVFARLMIGATLGEVESCVRLQFSKRTRPAAVV
jgi:hypothetical protein